MDRADSKGLRQGRNSLPKSRKQHNNPHLKWLNHRDNPRHKDVPRPANKPALKQEEILLLIISVVLRIYFIINPHEEIAEAAKQQEELVEEEAVHPHHPEVNRLPHQECRS